MSSPVVEATLTVATPLRLWAARPEGGDGPFPVLVALHGYAMTAPELLPVFRRMAPGHLVIAPQGPHSTFVQGTETTERRIGYHWGLSPDPAEPRALHRASVAAAIAWALQNGGDADRVSLAGFSQPCSFNYRIALDPPHGRPFRSLVALCGGVPGDWKESVPAATEASRACRVFHVSTREDAFYPLERVMGFPAVLEPRFASVTHRLLAGGHRIPSAAFEEVRTFLEGGHG